MESISDRVSYFLFDNPWPMLAAVALAWVIVFVLNRGGAWTRLQSILPIVAGLLLLLSYLVDTDRELIDRTLTDIIAAAERKDAAGVLAHFDLPISAPPGAHSQAWLEARLKLGLPWVDRLKLHSPDVKVNGDTATCLMEVAAPPRLLTADLEWKKVAGQWKVTGLRNPAWRIGPSPGVKVQ